MIKKKSLNEKAHASWKNRLSKNMRDYYDYIAGYKAGYKRALKDTGEVK